MSKFELIHFTDEEGRDIEIGSTRVRKLSINGTCMLDKYWESIDADLQDIFQSRLEEISDAIFPPPNKFKELRKDGNDSTKDYELREKYKKQMHRVYLFKFKTQYSTYVIVLGERKTNDKDQKKTIARFRKIKAEFIAEYQNN